jgi:hypothetical protein
LRAGAGSRSFVTLVSRFRSSQVRYGTSDANFGIKGTLMDFSGLDLTFPHELADNDRSFKSTAPGSHSPSTTVATENCRRRHGTVRRGFLTPCGRNWGHHGAPCVGPIWDSGLP